MGRDVLCSDAMVTRIKNDIFAPKLRIVFKERVFKPNTKKMNFKIRELLIIDHRLSINLVRRDDII
jgi:hypothetical protein